MLSSHSRTSRRKVLNGNTVKSDVFAARVLPIIKSLHVAGLSMRRIAATLTARRVETARGGKWSAVQVSALLRREPVSRH